MIADITEDTISHANDNANSKDIFSKHAMKNCQRRGIKGEAADAVLIHGDLVADRGNGVTLIQVSNPKLRQLGARTPEGVQTDRLKNLCLLIANDNTMVTAIRPRRGRYKIGRKVEG
jgi:hypothetical protein